MVGGGPLAGTWKAPKGWTALRAKVFAAKGRQCWWCGRPADTVDHVRPLILGGTSELDNLVPSCRRCNFSRGAALGNRLRRRGVPVSAPSTPWTPSRDW
jgi:5-methylcytosine-specific restriction endonuclease McrA